MEPYSQTIGNFVHGLDFGEVPQAVSEKAKLVFIDTLGIALASSTMDFGAMVLNVAKKLGGAAESRLIGTDVKVAGANAVLANGALAHGRDYDDTLGEAIVHTGCAAATTALAVYGTLPPLRRPLEDHRRHRASPRDRQDPQACGLVRPGVAPIARAVIRSIPNGLIPARDPLPPPPTRFGP